MFIYTSLSWDGKTSLYSQIVSSLTLTRSQHNLFSNNLVLQLSEFLLDLLRGILSPCFQNLRHYVGWLSKGSKFKYCDWTAIVFLLFLAFSLAKSGSHLYHWISSKNRLSLNSFCRYENDASLVFSKMFFSCNERNRQIWHVVHIKLSTTKINQVNLESLFIGGIHLSSFSSTNYLLEVNK